MANEYKRAGTELLWPMDFSCYEVKQNPEYLRILSMARARVLRHGAIYHVTVRANRKEMIFYCPAMKKLFLEIVKRSRKKYRFDIYNFCIMTNHVHFIIRPINGESLSRIMQWILSVFAMAWNKRHFTSGHVWGSRFRSQILGNFHVLMHQFEYISNNPVKACLVQSAQDWPYGGTYHFLKNVKEILEDPPFMIKLLYETYQGDN
ncbi:transposase [Treponema sp. OttesenSCG-928-L16]|nr:transposase [Treponema sp. OttesenSCG-928-L16]